METVTQIKDNLSQISRRIDFKAVFSPNYKFFKDIQIFEWYISWINVSRIVVIQYFADTRVSSNIKYEHIDKGGGNILTVLVD